MRADRMGVATTSGYWDALAGAALCGRRGSVLVLVSDERSHSISGFVRSHAKEISDGYIFGGPAAVSKATAKALGKATFDKSLYKLYKDILVRAANGTGECSRWPKDKVSEDYKAEYTLHDIDQDGINELIVYNASASEAGKQCIVFTISNASVVNCGSFSMWHGNLRYLTNQSLYLSQWDPHGYRYITPIYLDETKLKLGKETSCKYEQGDTFESNMNRALRIAYGCGAVDA